MRRESLIEAMRRSLPAAWDRTNTTELTGGVIHSETLKKLMSEGEGPSGAFRMGKKKVIIERESFLAWLGPRIEPSAKSLQGRGKKEEQL